MLSIVNANQPRNVGFPDDLAIDAVFSACPAFATFVLALLFGGFMFFQPWAIFGSLTHCALGILRGKSEGNLALKALCLSGATLLMVGVFGRPVASSIAITAGFTVVPAATGIWARRRFARPT